ncbi:facilitated trehalose transporter Tret1-2 homolog [Photinus pyralis]|uniref:facilitated trehalose transporter Tret1-2 homolog n=1 Tax=Photinus pyralis TaxID=7054 RepID=UPI0012672D8A|nr:facilitated trehalose transporter Tret1-2 homolog [Photinus pyralis]
MPETPYWLLFHNKLEEARKSLAWVRGWTTVEDVEQELREMEQFVKEKLCRVDHQTKDGGKRLCEKYFRKNFLWPFSLITVLFFILCFSGVLMLQIYGVVIFATLKVPMDKYYAEMLMGLSQLLGSMASVFAVRICGKRVMAFVTIGGLFVLNFCFATYAYVANIERLDFAGVDTSSSSSSSEYMAWIPLVLVILISFVGHCGPRVLPWIMMGEIFSNYMRAEGCAFTGCMYYILFAAASMGYLNMISTLTFSGVYWTYAGVCFFGIVFVYYALPETEGKTLVDISHHFSGQEKLSNKVNRKSISAPSPSSALGPV